MRAPYLVVMAFFAFAGPANAASPCQTDTQAHVLDFWIGNWTVTNADGTPSGKNRVERVLDGCAIIENWQGVDSGDEGKSLFAYDAAAHSWEQTWVAPDTSRPGGLKHKRLIAVFPDGGTRFQGELKLPDGRILLDRTTLTPQKDGRVRQVIELSRDGGSSWTAGFDAYYAKRK